MSSFGELFTGSSGGFYNYELITTSGTWVAPSSGKYLITAIGGGGGGNLGTSARGGAGGGLSQSLVSLSTGQSLVLVIGAGGIASTTGGNTTVTGTDILLTANGGAGGNGTTSAIGGTATGGNVMNVQGGDSGNITGSGGGAVGVYGKKPPSSGLYNGAGVSTSGAISPLNQGGHSLPNIANISTFNGRILSPIGIGGYSTGMTSFDPSVDGRPGGGGGYGIYSRSGHGGFFAGGASSGSSGIPAGNGGLFGGGGGSGWHSAGGAPAGVGGSGGVIIEWLKG